MSQVRRGSVLDGFGVARQGRGLSRIEPSINPGPARLGFGAAWKGRDRQGSVGSGLVWLGKVR